MINYIIGLVKDYVSVIDSLSKELISVLFNTKYSNSQMPVRERNSGLENKANQETQ